MGGSVPHAVGRPAKESPDRLTWGRPPPGASVPQKGLEARPSGRSPSGLTSGASAAIAASRPGKGEESPGACLPLVAWDGPPHGLAGLGLPGGGVHLTDPATGPVALRQGDSPPHGPGGPARERGSPLRVLRNPHAGRRARRPRAPACDGGNEPAYRPVPRAGV